jgi:hypothetical protein
MAASCSGTRCHEPGSDLSALRSADPCDVPNDRTAARRRVEPGARHRAQLASSCGNRVLPATARPVSGFFTVPEWGCPDGSGGNLFFVRPHSELDAREVVMYNPRDEHRFTSHELDILQYDGAQLDLGRGDRRRSRLTHPLWSSILFD